MPGFMLAKKINEVYSKNPNIDCLILMNHGIFTFAYDAKEALSNLGEIRYAGSLTRLLRAIYSTFSNCLGELSAVVRFALRQNSERVRQLLGRLRHQVFLDALDVRKLSEHYSATMRRLFFWPSAYRLGQTARPDPDGSARRLVARFGSAPPPSPSPPPAPPPRASPARPSPSAAQPQPSLA